jgi:hypothetical protein
MILATARDARPLIEIDHYGKHFHSDFIKSSALRFAGSPTLSKQKQSVK